MANDEEYRARIRDRVEGYAERERKKLAPKTRRNAKPEKSVESVCIQWLGLKGFSVHVYESKAKYLPGKGYTSRTPLPVGHSDCAGVDPYGIGVYVEFKAPGRLVYSSISPEQRAFILDKINHSAFAIATDNLELLQKAYAAFIQYRRQGNHHAAKVYLKGLLPKPKV